MSSANPKYGLQKDKNGGGGGATSSLGRAIRHPENFEPLLVCTVVFMVVGILMMICGGIVCLIYYTEITPPNFDTNYHRYVGSSMPRIVGPLMMAFGGFLTLGDIIMIAFAINQLMKAYDDGSTKAKSVAR